MALVFKGGGFVHIPKTGGRWVLANIEAAGIKHTKYGEYHSNPDISGKVFVCVRRPDSFLKSYFNHHNNEKHWGSGAMNWEIDECKSDSIDGFVENVINNNGVVGRYFDYWMNNDCLVGRTETLPESFIAFTKLLGYSCNEEAVRRNKNNYKSHGVEFPFEYEKAIKSSESVFINKYYPEWSC